MSGLHIFAFSLLTGANSLSTLPLPKEAARTKANRQGGKQERAPAKSVQISEGTCWSSNTISSADQRPDSEALEDRKKNIKLRRSILKVRRLLAKLEGTGHYALGILT